MERPILLFTPEEWSKETAPDKIEALIAKGKKFIASVDEKGYMKDAHVQHLVELNSNAHVMIDDLRKQHMKHNSQLAVIRLDHTRNVSQRDYWHNKHMELLSSWLKASDEKLEATWDFKIRNWGDKLWRSLRRP